MVIVEESEPHFSGRQRLAEQAACAQKLQHPHVIETLSTRVVRTLRCEGEGRRKCFQLLLFQVSMQLICMFLASDLQAAIPCS